MKSRVNTKNKEKKDIQRREMTEADWSKRFDELIELDLIELPEKFYEDELYFKNTE